MSTSDYHPFNLCNKLYIHILEAVNKFCAELQRRRYEVATFVTDIASDLLSAPYYLVYAVFELLYLQGTEVWGGEGFLTLPQQKEI